MKGKNGKGKTVAEYFFSEKKELEFAVWMAGLLLGVFAMAVLLLDYYTPFSIEGLQYDCWIRKQGGFYCPGCGGTRAFFAFLEGSFVKSFLYHPVVPYMGVIYIVFMLRGALHFSSKGRFAFMRFRIGYIYVAVAITIIQFVIKNVYLLNFRLK